MNKADFTAADARRLYWQFNELTEDGRLVNPDNEVEVAYFSTEGGKDIFELKDALTDSTIDFVYSDGTSYRPSFFQRLRDRVRSLLSFTRYERNEDISMADVLGIKTN